MLPNWPRSVTANIRHGSPIEYSPLLINLIGVRQVVRTCGKQGHGRSTRQPSIGRSSIGAFSLLVSGIGVVRVSRASTAKRHCRPHWSRPLPVSAFHCTPSGVLGHAASPRAAGCAAASMAENVRFWQVPRARARRLNRLSRPENAQFSPGVCWGGLSAHAMQGCERLADPAEPTAEGRLDRFIHAADLGRLVARPGRALGRRW